MAKVVISVDTIKEEANLTIDGKPLINVHTVYLYTKESGYFGLEISSIETIANISKLTKLFTNDRGELIPTVKVVTDVTPLNPPDIVQPEHKVSA